MDTEQFMYLFQSSLHDVKWHFRYGHWKPRIFKFARYVGPEEFNLTEKTEVIVLHFQVSIL
jgi:hypothetical protein